MPTQIVVASTNPVKVEATRRGFHRMFPDEASTMMIESVSVPSGVREQPLSNAETLRGARQRVQGAIELIPSADYWVGLEGGIEADDHGVGSFAWIVIRSPQMSGQSRTGTFYLPPRVIDLMRRGKELGEANDLVFGASNSKHHSGAIGLLSADVVDRTQLYEQAVILALVSFKNPELYIDHAEPP